MKELFSSLKLFAKILPNLSEPLEFPERCCNNLQDEIP
jgi:hypothetical protein